MNATIVARGAKAVPPVVSSVQDIPLENIRESSSNPRRVFDEAQLRELAANIQLHGVLQAILVRPSQDGANGVYELVAGARRFRASKLAGKRTIPATVRNLTDSEAQEIRLIENLQRTNTRVGRGNRLSVIDGLEAGLLHGGDDLRAGCQKPIVCKRAHFPYRTDPDRQNRVLRRQALCRPRVGDCETSAEGPREGLDGMFP